MPAPSFIETLSNLKIPHQVEVSDTKAKAIVTINDEALTSEQAHSLHQLITDPDSPKTAIIALKILAKQTNMDPKYIGNICIFQGNATEIYHYPPNTRSF